MRDVYDIALLVRARARRRRLSRVPDEVDARRADEPRGSRVSREPSARRHRAEHPRPGRVERRDQLRPAATATSTTRRSATTARTRRVSKIYFTDSHVAAISKRYGEIFQRERAAAQGRSVNLLEQHRLRPRQPRPAGRRHLDRAAALARPVDLQRGRRQQRRHVRARLEPTSRSTRTGLVDGVEACVPIRR